MFERFTPEARRATVLAQDEARSAHHVHIDTPHFLVALTHAGGGVATQALASCGVTVVPAREQLMHLLPHKRKAKDGHIPFTPRAKTILEYALHEAMQLNHNHIGTEHLLLGIVRDGEKRTRLGRRDPGGACELLLALGVDLDQVRSAVLQLLAGDAREPEQEQDGDQPSGWWPN